MSEEFSISVSFKTNDAEHMEAVETLLEHLDLYEVDEARELLGRYDLNKAIQSIDELTSPHSGYGNGVDLIKMYIDTYHDSVDDDERNLDVSTLKGEIEIEGHDHDADDFCAALVLILIGMGVNKLKANAGSPFWYAQWKSDNKNHVTAIFEGAE